MHNNQSAKVELGTHFIFGLIHHAQWYVICRNLLPDMGFASSLFQNIERHTVNGYSVVSRNVVALVYIAGAGLATAVGVDRRCLASTKGAGGILAQRAAA